MSTTHLSPALQAAVKTEWDQAFVTNPSFTAWIEYQLVHFPIQPGVVLRDYVVRQLEASGVSLAHAQLPGPAATPAPPPQHGATSHTHPYAAQYPQASNGVMQGYNAYASNGPVATTVPGSFAMPNPATYARQAAAAPLQPTSIDPRSLVNPRPQPTNFVPYNAPQPQPVASTSTAVHPKPSTSAAIVNATTGLPANAPMDPWARGYAGIKADLETGRMTKFPTRTADHIIKLVHTFENGADVPVAGRADILRVIGNATRAPPEKFCAAWAREEKGRSVLETWLKEAVNKWNKAKADDKADDAAAKQLLVPILRTLGYLPITVEELRTVGWGKYISALAKEKDTGSKYPAAACRLAAELQASWRILIDASKQRDREKASAPVDSKKRPEANGTVPDDEARKKRKATPSSTIDVKPDIKPANASVGFLKSSTPSALKGLSIARTKKPTPKAESPTPVAAPAPSTNAFSQALGLMSKKDGSAMSTSDASKRSGVKKRKSVRWRPDEELVQVKEIERAVYDDEIETMTESGEARQLDMDEGNAFRHHDLEEIDEQVDWTEPSTVRVPLPAEPPLTYPDPESLKVFTRSEADVQAEREARTLSVSYEDASEMPESAGEPTEEESGYEPVREMIIHPSLLAMPEIEHALHVMQSNDYSTPGGVEGDHVQSDVQISNILGQLTGNGATAAPTNAFSGANMATLQSLLSQTSTPAVPLPASAPTSSPFDLLSKLDPNLLSSLGSGSNPVAPTFNPSALLPPTSSVSMPTGSHRVWGAPSAPAPNGNAALFGDANLAASLAALIQPQQQPSQAGPQRSSGWGAEGNGMPTAAVVAPRQQPKRRNTPAYAGKKRIPCKFYPLGTCHEGDACTFKH